MKTVLEMNDKYLMKLVNYYKAYQVDSPSPHMSYRFQSDEFAISVYSSKKVLFQGEKGIEEYLKWAELLGVEPIIQSQASLDDYINEFYEKTVIGSDEVGTGDFFGPIVVTAALVGKKDYDFLSQYNIQDSKKISDIVITQIAPHLIRHIPHQTLVLHNPKYNELTNKGYNMNKIKAYLHNHAIKKMVSKQLPFDTVIVDAFCSRKNYFNYLKDQQTYQPIQLIEKGESVHLSVAVAAIIARYQFLQEMDKLSKSINITIPKGASKSVDAISKLIVLKHGKAIFNKIAKCNFKNYQRIQ